ncbi:hypothetical protein JCM24511_05231 [Saitozyma sp. JCM 24511]|nr:hypothetical protein JCM24511_05231 [Saitozyma sp. JCM 24511]
MSLRTISLSALPLARANARTLSTTAVYRKSVVDQVKDAAQTVNKKVGQTLASGIETAEATTSQAKETVREKSPSESDVKKTAESARQNVNHSLGQAAGKARDVKDDVKKQL